MPAQLLDPDAISRGESLGLMARRIVEGYRVGEHRSPFHGFAIEFAQHREYTPGDDIRHLDWKVLGRSDRYYIKQYEQDTNYVAHIVVDGTTSMRYGSKGLTKLQFAKALAACLSYLILQQRDAVALALFDTEVREYLPRTDSFGRLQHIMDRLAAFDPTFPTSLGKALEQVSQAAGRRGIVIILSDLFDDEEGLNRGLRLLNYSGNEVILFQILDHDEIEFPFTGTCKFRDLEGSTEVQTSPADIRKAYLESFGAFRRRMIEICEKYNTHYVLADTSKSLAEVLSGYLAFRLSMTRK